MAVLYMKDLLGCKTFLLPESFLLARVKCFTSFRDRALITIEVAINATRKGGLNCDPFKIIPETLNYVLYTQENSWLILVQQINNQFMYIKDQNVLERDNISRMRKMILS